MKGFWRNYAIEMRKIMSLLKMKWIEKLVSKKN